MTHSVRAGTQFGGKGLGLRGQAASFSSGAGAEGGGRWRRADTGISGFCLSREAHATTSEGKDLTDNADQLDAPVVGSLGAVALLVQGYRL